MKQTWQVLLEIAISIGLLVTEALLYSFKALTNASKPVCYKTKPYLHGDDDDVTCEVFSICQ